MPQPTPSRSWCSTVPRACRVLPPPQSLPGALQQLTALGFGVVWALLPHLLSGQLRAHAERQPGRMAFPQLARIYMFEGDDECHAELRGLMQAGVLPTVPIKDINDYYADTNG